MLNVVTFLWDSPGYRSKYSIEHVEIMRRMVARHYSGAHRFHCVTDRLKNLHDVHHDNNMSWHKLWDDYADVQNPHGAGNPSCYRRLKLWSEWARETIGERILQIDLDMVLVDSVDTLWNRPEPCVLWADNLNKTSPYNGAMQLFTPGGELGRKVWEGFDPVRSPKKGKAAGYFGSDQAWIALALGPNEARWKADDGAVSWRVHCKPNGGDLPKGAKVVNFHGQEDPWTLSDRVAWIAEHYR
jgi:hypothetical protein